MPFDYPFDYLAHLRGAPYAIELPIYGSKAIGVRLVSVLGAQHSALLSGTFSSLLFTLKFTLPELVIAKMHILIPCTCAQGWLILHGQHKTPVWTQLNATANVGDTSITVNGVVNWVAGGWDGYGSKLGNAPPECRQ